ncbi:MAG: two-component regulator propeller domain-containing protein [Bacteroidota bacterium]|nr:two-component regulator propeller domain-containing protein [Bacteroidota bacterium]MDP4196872.1 two-component regulator propeller domain-containing protein [Bacteroidota bacterium]
MKSLIIFSILFLTCICSAQNELWKHYYSHNHVTSIAAKGDYLWIGYDCGLERRNIISGKVDLYFTYNSGLPKSNIIKTIAIDSEGDLWTATGGYQSHLEYANGYYDGGLAKFNGTKWIELSDRFNNFNSLNDFSFVAADNHNNIWINIRSIGPSAFYRYDLGRDSAFIVSGSYIDSTKPWGNIVSAAFDDSGHSWFATSDAGLIKYDGKTWTRFNKHYYNIPTDSLTSVAVDKKRTVWVGTYNLGIVKYDSSSWTVFNRSNSDLPSDFVSAVTVDSSGNVWAGTNNGIAQYNGIKWIVYNDSNSSLPDKHISSLTVDSKGNLWAGTNLGGYAMFDGKAWLAYNSSNSRLKNNNILDIAADSSNTIWIISQGAVYRVRGDNWIDVSNENTVLKNKSVFSVSVDRKSNKWFLASENCTCGYPTLAIKYNDTTWTIFDSTNTNPLIKKFTSVAFDSSGNTWFSIDCGLAKYDGKNWSAYLSSDNVPPLCPSNAFCLTVKADGNVFWGNEEGIIRFDGTKWFEFYRGYKGIAGVHDLAVDHRGSLWAAMAANDGSRLRGGLTKFEGYKETSFYLNCGPWFWSIAIDNMNNKWMGGKWCGLIKIDGVNDSSTSVFNTANSGMPDNQISSIAIDKYNRKWIASPNTGIVLYISDQVIPVNVDKNGKRNPLSFSLLQNYPNPFNPLTIIGYTLAKDSFVSLKLYDILGREIIVLENGFRTAGPHNVKLDGSSLPSGIYIYRLKAGQFNDSKKLVLLR